MLIQMDTEIRKIVLKNAIDYKGKASAKSVIPKILGAFPEAKKNIKEVVEKVNALVSEINSLTLEEQINQLRDLAPELLEKKEKRKKSLKDLPNAVEGKFVARLPPEPGKYLHVGHAIGFYINYLYTQKYKGKLILRFEDTNPQIPKKEYYDAIREDLKAINIHYDQEIIESNNMEQYYSYGEQLIKENLAYACSCSKEEISKKRRNEKECSCRNRSTEENLSIWKAMHADVKEGEFIIRLKGNMKDKDPLLRDPTIFRIIDAEHPLQGRKYRVWPSYDFAVAIEDGLNVTHVLRGAEFLQRTPLQNHIRSLLGIKNPEIIHYSRVNIIGGLTSGREIRKLIQEENTTWDDPRLMTIRALLRRGINPETFKLLAINVGISLAETNLDYKHISGTNKKLIDPIAKRCFFVADPIKLIVEGAPEKEAEIPVHPKNEKLGKRKIKTNGVIWLAKDDLHEGKLRLKDLYTIEIKKEGEEYKAKFLTEVFEKGTEVIQWVPSDFVKMNLIIPEGKKLITVKGYAEPTIQNYPVGEIIQLERVGYGRIDSKEPEVNVIFSHK
ncbi:MAG: glutamate--tRNA ligase [Candidatus Heimdallarchaeum aukensis]|uniref:Glutamate--tRNA ligase n=1 Tax=Candidatus Heimdallarchaeum aukensis TaxID=2876573 RepID=A0A9Y1FM59_9ARCH|nr:MAG: glutamate--tRNA ligase [Candidatus Heimdallarchaeum aukensis]